MGDFARKASLIFNNSAVKQKYKPVDNSKSSYKLGLKAPVQHVKNYAAKPQYHGLKAPIAKYPANPHMFSALDTVHVGDRNYAPLQDNMLYHNQVVPNYYHGV